MPQKKVTENLANLILNQEQDISLYDEEATNSILKEIQSQKETFLKQKFQDLASSISDSHLKRCLTLNQEKGSGSWLTALPLKDHGFCLNKQELQSACSMDGVYPIHHTSVAVVLRTVLTIR